ncbi:MAG TPA: hypothetical protein VE981_11485 [Planctomycetota bacterium]|nr:hypothetical protein [Planctomycetota bacterium]
MRIIKTAGVLGLLAALSACSTFDQDWQASQGFANGIEGRWEGSWTSDDNGHTGGLRCLVTRRADEGYDARYHATYSGWCGTLSFEYTVPMTVQPGPQGLQLHGSADLGWIAGGVYEYDGLVNVDRYYCNYQSDGDHGIFKLERPR